MGNIKVHKQKGFTQIPNAVLRRDDLSWKAKGLLSYLLTLDDSWKIFKADLKNRSKDGYDSTLSAFTELEDAGYIETIKIKTGNLFTGVEYVVYDYPVPRIRDFPESGDRERENPQLINNSLNKKEINEKSKKTKAERISIFREKLIPFLKTKNNTKGYDGDFMKIFFEYWTETSDEVRSLRFEDEKFFDMKRRLSTFSARQNKPNSNNSYTSTIADN